MKGIIYRFESCPDCKKNKVMKMIKQVKYFVCNINELEKINEGLQIRNIDANSVISITGYDEKKCVIVWYRETIEM